MLVVSKPVFHQVSGSLPSGMETFTRYRPVRIEPILVRQFKSSLEVVKTFNVYVMPVGYLIELAATPRLMNGTDLVHVFA